MRSQQELFLAAKVLIGVCGWSAESTVIIIFKVRAIVGRHVRSLVQRANTDDADWTIGYNDGKYTRPFFAPAFYPFHCTAQAVYSV